MAAISDFVLEQAQRIGFNEKATYAIQLAVDEACSNIIEHAYGGEGIGEIDLTCNLSDDQLEIILKDSGKPFDPEDIPDLDATLPIDEVGERGAGVYLMHKLMDEVQFNFSKGTGTTLIMRKKK